jgi:hypothetical protein
VNKKYEFVEGDEIVIAPGRTVKRIRALVAISYFCSAGSLGGYIESEKSLDQSGNAWVSGDAQVSGNARVSGNAQVSGDGLIVLFSHVGSENGTLTAYNTKDNSIEVTRGCFRGSIDAFLEASEKKHDDQTHLEYRMLIEVAHSRITRALSKE